MQRDKCKHSNVHGELWEIQRAASLNTDQKAQERLSEGPGLSSELLLNTFITSFWLQKLCTYM